MSEIFKNLPWYKKMEVLRTIKGWSQTETAEKCGTNQKGYWNWESGQSYPILNNRKAIASVFGVEVYEIFGDDKGVC